MVAVGQASATIGALVLSGPAQEAIMSLISRAIFRRAAIGLVVSGGAVVNGVGARW